MDKEPDDPGEASTGEPSPSLNSMLSYQLYIGVYWLHIR